MTLTHSKSIQIAGADVQKEAFIIACCQANNVDDHQADRPAPAPTVREVMRAIQAFTRSIAASEAFARGQVGGVVRIQAMAPVLAAINEYMAQLPATELEP